MKFDRFELNESCRELRRHDGSLVPLTTAEFDLLCVFVRNPLRSLTRSEVIELLPRKGARESGRSVDVTLSRLRRKIEMDPRHPVLIKTIRHRGYVFTVVARDDLESALERATSGAL
ncbi:MAG: hypothetical protein GC190_21225 [Alphaproteobacteria bacterium]|nr:hypothetical protein [Alphaproteobacteria bacterium]